jgi:6-phosphofructokinase 1
LASQFGVKAFKMVLDGEFGKMVAYRNNDIVSVTLKEAVAQYNFVKPDSRMVRTARGLGISFCD